MIDQEEQQEVWQKFLRTLFCDLREAKKRKIENSEGREILKFELLTSKTDKIIRHLVLMN